MMHSINPEQETITFTARLTIKSGKENEFEAIMKEVVPKVRAEEGNLAYTMCRSKENPHLFLFFEEYVDQDAIEAHSMHLDQMDIDFAAYLEGPPVAEYFVKIAD